LISHLDLIEQNAKTKTKTYHLRSYIAAACKMELANLMLIQFAAE